jgi:hypothetical protein
MELPRIVAGWSVFSLDWHGQRTEFVTCFYSPALHFRSCRCPYIYWKHVGGCWPRISASVWVLLVFSLIGRLLISGFYSSLLPIPTSPLVE